MMSCTHSTISCNQQLPGVGDNSDNLPGAGSSVPPWLAPAACRCWRGGRGGRCRGSPPASSPPPPSAPSWHRDMARTLVTITHLVWSPQPSPKYTISPEDSLSWEQKRVEKYELLAAKTICLENYCVLEVSCKKQDKTQEDPTLCALICFPNTSNTTSVKCPCLRRSGMS